MFSGKALGAKSTTKGSLLIHFDAKDVRVVDAPVDRSSTRLKDKPVLNYEEQTESDMINDLEVMHDQNTHHDVVEMLKKKRDNGFIDLTNVNSPLAEIIDLQDVKEPVPVVEKAKKLSVFDMMMKNKPILISDDIQIVSDVPRLNEPERERIVKPTNLQIVDDPSMDNELLELIGEDCDESQIKDSQNNQLEIPNSDLDVAIIETELKTTHLDVTMEEPSSMDVPIKEGQDPQSNSDEIIEISSTPLSKQEPMQVVQTQDAQSSAMDIAQEEQLQELPLRQEEPTEMEDIVSDPIIYRMKKGKLEFPSASKEYLYHPEIVPKLEQYHQYNELNKLSSIPPEFEYLVPILMTEQNITLKTFLPLLKTMLKNPDLDDAGLKTIVKNTVKREQYGVTSSKVPSSLSIFVWDINDDVIAKLPVSNDLRFEIAHRKADRIANKSKLDAFVTQMSMEDRELFLSGKSKWHITLSESLKKQDIVVPPKPSKKRPAPSPKPEKVKKVKIEVPKTPKTPKAPKPVKSTPISQKNTLDFFVKKSPVVAHPDVEIVLPSDVLFGKSMQYQQSLHSNRCAFSSSTSDYVDSLINGMDTSEDGIDALLQLLINDISELPVTPHTQLNNPHVVEQHDELTGAIYKHYRKTIIMPVSLQQDIIDTIWMQQSTVITGKQPFNMDTKYLNYDDDSDVEMEMGEIEEMDDEDEKDKESEDEEESTSFAVPHGYLSADEGGSDCNENEEDQADDKKAILKPWTSTVEYCDIGSEMDLVRNKSIVYVYYGTK